MATESKSEGIEGLYLETRNWGKTVAFWQALGYTLDFETDHHSGQLTHPNGGPYLFVAEHTDPDHVLETHLIVKVGDSTTFEPPAGVTVDQPFTPQHWGVVDMMVRDPDGRPVSFQAPPPPGTETPPGHH